ncbi:CHAD domain-containing protein [Aureimonas sp. SK2]|uniref:CHAD domain-containing protein n=1 Tax=Aureimonas sp. SK2 TaxID=3015992 RepID=UPI00244422E4|nr:CHAD domain-containing protein [Aureimonas sp. SK2]
MAYRFDPRIPVDASIRRAAQEQIDKAVRDLSDGEDNRHEAVHEARKRLKKLRGLVRLLRAAEPNFAAAENARYRDAGRTLSGVRDRTALIEALDGLEARFAGEVESPSFAVVRTALELKRQAAIEAQGSAEDVAAAAIRSLKEGRLALDALVLGRKAGRNRGQVVSAIEANYRRGRRDLKTARRSGHAEDFHDLRKRIKYLGMHLKLLEDVWPAVIAPLREEADRAADALGRDHDYAVLHAEMLADPRSFGARADLDIVLALLDRHQTELRAEAAETCGRLLAETPEAFAARIARLWDLAAKAPDPAAPPEPAAP